MHVTYIRLSVHVQMKIENSMIVRRTSSEGHWGPSMARELEQSRWSPGAADAGYLDCSELGYCWVKRTSFLPISNQYSEKGEAEASSHKG